MNFDSKVVVITGAGSGMGEAIALHFAKLFAKLSLLDINAENLQKAIEKCDNLNKYKSLKIVIDVTNDEKVKEAVDRTIEEFGRIDVLINCAGIVNNTGILNSDFISIYDKIMNLNLRSYVVVTHYAVKALVASKGCIINISSMCGKVVDKNCIPYSVSKAAVIHFTKNAALELADKGVRANCILPGFVETKFLIHSGLNQDDIAKTIEKIKIAPLTKIIQPEEIAEMAVYLASDKAKSITGAEFVIDSGRILLGPLFKDE